MRPAAGASRRTNSRRVAFFIVTAMLLRVRIRSPARAIFAIPFWFDRRLTADHGWRPGERLRPDWFRQFLGCIGVSGFLLGAGIDRRTMTIRVLQFVFNCGLHQGVRIGFCQVPGATTRLPLRSIGLSPGPLSQALQGQNKEGTPKSGESPAAAKQTDPEGEPQGEIPRSFDPSPATENGAVSLRSAILKCNVPSAADSLRYTLERMSREEPIVRATLVVNPKCQRSRLQIDADDGQQAEMRSR